MKDTKIKTKKLLIRPLNDDELERRRYEQTDAQRQKAYADMLAGCREHSANRLWYTAWEATLRQTGERIGDICFKGETKNREVEIEYFPAEKFKDSEAAADAVDELAAWGFANSDELYFVSVWVDAQSEDFAKTLDDRTFSVVEETETKLRFEMVRSEMAWLPIGMCLGVGIGSGFGLLFDSLALGMCIGVSLGVTFGLLKDAKNKKIREEILSEHTGEEPEED